MKREDLIYEEQKKLVLARLNTINPRLNTINPGAKIMLGTKNKISVKELIDHVEKGDDFGNKIIKAQMTMLRVLAGSA